MHGHALVRTDDPLLGAMVGRYRLARVLGEGGMGRVYLGVQPEIGSRVAIKMLTASAAEYPELLERFFAEAHAVNQIRHENIVSIIDHDRLPDGRPYLVMEYVDGGTLRAYVRAGVTRIDAVVRILIDVLLALEAAHAVGIIHRDLKLENIVITASGRAKVLDFGIAKLATTSSSRPGPRTQTGVLLGTPDYMAPEQILGGAVDARTDIYAAGVVLFEAITGRRLFQESSDFAIMRAHVDAAPPSPRALRPDMPHTLEHVIFQAIAKQPDDRFQSAIAMSRALRHVASELGGDQWRTFSSEMPRQTPSRPIEVAAATRDDRGSGRTVEPSTRVEKRMSGLDDTDIDPAATVPARPSAGGLRAHARPSGSEPVRPSGSVPVRPSGSDPTVEASRTVPNLETRARRRSRRGLVALAGTGVVAATLTFVLLARSSSSPHTASPIPGDAMQLVDSERVVEQVVDAAVRVVDAASAAAVVPDAVETIAAVVAPVTAEVTAPVDAAVPAEAPSDGPPSRPNTRVAIAAPHDAGPPPPRTIDAGSLRDRPPVRPVDTDPAPPDVVHRKPPVVPPQTAKPSYNPKNFDWRAFVPHATSVARGVAEDARLVEISLYAVSPDGRVDLTTKRDRNTVFRFHSAREVGCIIEVTVKANGVAARATERNCMAGRYISLPRCSTARVWEMARARGLEGDLADLSFNASGWIVTGVSMITSPDDDC